MGHACVLPGSGLPVGGCGGRAQQSGPGSVSCGVSVSLVFRTVPVELGGGRQDWRQ